MPNRVVGCCQVQEDITRTRFQISLKTILDVCGECCYLDTRAPTSTEPCLVLGVTLCRMMRSSSLGYDDNRQMLVDIVKCRLSRFRIHTVLQLSGVFDLLVGRKCRSTFRHTRPTFVGRQNVGCVFPA